ncbi:MAG: hypothetical protein ACK5LT_10300 [Lachnospirales bacterium]
MDILTLIALMVSIVYLVQICTSIFIYFIYMKKLQNFHVIYRNYKYLKIAILLLFMFLILILVFRVSIVAILYPFLTYISFRYFKKYYKNNIMKNDDYVYNGVATFKTESIKNVFIENGANLEKKYGTKYIGIEKYKKSDYIVMEFVNGKYVLIKEYDSTYLRNMHNLIKFN